VENAFLFASVIPILVFIGVGLKNECVSLLFQVETNIGKAQMSNDN
jgi:hypothetical protein